MNPTTSVGRGLAIALAAAVIDDEIEVIDMLREEIGRFKLHASTRELTSHVLGECRPVWNQHTMRFTMDSALDQIGNYFDRISGFYPFDSEEALQYATSMLTSVMNDLRGVDEVNQTFFVDDDINSQRSFAIAMAAVSHFVIEYHSWTLRHTDEPLTKEELIQRHRAALIDESLYAKG